MVLGSPHLPGRLRAVSDTPFFEILPFEDVQLPKRYASRSSVGRSSSDFS